VTCRPSVRWLSALLAVIVPGVVSGLAFPAQAQEPRGFYPASTNAIVYVGRTQRSNSVLWTWPGVGLRVVYGSSRSISLRFRAPDFPDDSTPNRVKLIWYHIDDNPWLLVVVPPNSAADYPLSAPADLARHRLEVVKASEGQVLFEGITLEPGGKLARPSIPAHRIEIVGDSITAGYKIKGSGSFENAADHDARASYGWLLGERLDAEVRLVAITGHGLVHNYGIPPAASKTMTQYYPFLYRDYATPNDWSWRPEIVVVNLGTNDIGPPEPTAPAEFQNAYNSFLSIIRGFNPRALIVALEPLGVENGAAAIYPAEIRAAVDMRRQAGDSRVIYVDTTGWLGAEDYTDGAHPNVSGHQKAAERLAAILQPLIGASK
jgi:lysophospholipase L1-like esterase